MKIFRVLHIMGDNKTRTSVLEMTETGLRILLWVSFLTMGCPYA
jgi:hypothetical protein